MRSLPLRPILYPLPARVLPLLLLTCRPLPGLIDAFAAFVAVPGALVADVVRLAVRTSRAVRRRGEDFGVRDKGDGCLTGGWEGIGLCGRLLLLLPGSSVVDFLFLCRHFTALLFFVSLWYGFVEVGVRRCGRMPSVDLAFIAEGDRRGEEGCADGRLGVSDGVETLVRENLRSHGYGGQKRRDPKWW